MGLFKPKWVRESEAKDRAAAKAQRAVERLTDPNDLIRVALESPWGTAQLSAVTRLDDDAALLAVLNASTEWYVHEAIVGKLRRQDALIHYMFYGKYSDARKNRAVPRGGSAGSAPIHPGVSERSRARAHEGSCDAARYRRRYLTRSRAQRERVRL
jgi:hypothetical protein